ncbi:MAG TPA: LacI family DNA-binding transcriptional regulator [Edaphobacter sp.]|nr:LacI family DNA-binding transcriptional regulator [Edaphobacter sp.]
MNKKTRMIDVARLAKVGTMTVSRVLNNSANVSEATAKRVHAAIAQLGYRPNEMARVLRGFKSKSIGLIVPSLADSFFAICANSINMVAQEHGYSMILTASNDNVDTELSEAQWMLQKHVEGLLVCPARTGSQFADPMFQQIPIVAFDRPMLIPRVPSVLVENYAGARRGTEHLIQKHNHERIHFLGDSKNLYSIQTRLNGYKHALSKAGLHPQATLECSSEEVIFEEVSRLLDGKRPPTAFFCGNNLVSRGLIRSLRKLGVEAPKDVAIIGFDDLELADMLVPSLTVIRQPVEQLGTIAAGVLFERLKTPATKWPKSGNRTTLKVELVVRSSCGCNHA